MQKAIHVGLVGVCCIGPVPAENLGYRIPEANLAKVSYARFGTVVSQISAGSAWLAPIGREDSGR